ncbi:MAG: DinB family protein [Parvularculaceae bacterium]|nr:DinB family protein [Parvularculaceae bacterium]
MRIDPDYARVMARYNRWQNQSCYREAARLSEAERKQDRGAFFKSIHGTLSHILFGDQIWLHRFAATPAPRAKSIKESADAYPDFTSLTDDRVAFDDDIIAWANALDPAWLHGDLTWFSEALGREVTRSRALLVVHFFNHQTHHRGQVHALLTSVGLKPDDTDLAFMT